MSGATVTLADDRPDVLEKVVQISGTPEQTEKAKSLLQGFILSSEFLSLSFLCHQYIAIYLPVFSFQSKMTVDVSPLCCFSRQISCSMF